MVSLVLMLTVPALALASVAFSRTATRSNSRIRAALLMAAFSATAALPVTAAYVISDEESDVPAILRRQTEELLAAVDHGDKGPWTRYLDDAVIYSAEDGSTKSKADLIAELRPFPEGIWGKLRLTSFRSAVHGPTAIANYVIEEEEGYFGQIIHARYRVTDTWIETGEGWRLAASQSLALKDDPPAVDLPAARLDEYVGVYALTPEITYTIRRRRGGLEGERTGRKPEPLKAELADCLFVPGQPRLRKIFHRDASGRISGFVERRESWDIAWRRLPASR